eukprot:XP_011661915.1 PREDICTED: uncharacterized protein LOC105437245 [Strongylocentrotus purpuratus]
MGRGSLLFLAAVMSSALLGGAIAETQDFPLYVGENLTLSCNYTGNATISWTFLGNDGADNITGVACNATCNYTSENITSADSGVYNCSVNNTVVSTYNIIVITMTTPSADASVSSAPSTSPDAPSSMPSGSTDAGITTVNTTRTSSQPTDADTATDNATRTPSQSTDAGTATDNATDGTTTDQPAGGSSLNVAVVAGGAAGGVVFLFLIIIIIIFLCKSKRNSDVDGVVHRPQKKTAKGGSKKHRSDILSFRHKLPLFSTPYGEDDDVEEKASDNGEYRPNSKVASQIRVNLEASDGDEGTIENGFVPAQLVTASDEDESPYSMGIVEGRLGIMGPGTFAALNADSKKADLVNENQNRSDGDDEDAETETAMNDPYTKVYKPNNPGDACFDNMTYGPIEGVDDKAKASMYDEEQITENSQAQDGKHLTSNETDNACDVDTPNGEDGHEDGVAKGDSEDTDITEKNQNTDRESAAYAEIP